MNAIIMSIITQNEGFFLDRHRKAMEKLVGCLCPLQSARQFAVRKTEKFILLYNTKRQMGGVNKPYVRQ